MSQPASNSSLLGRTNAEENVQRGSHEDVADTTSEKHTKAKTGNSRKHRVSGQAQYRANESLAGWPIFIQFRYREAWPATACFP